jgi:hypothetical protein
MVKGFNKLEHGVASVATAATKQALKLNPITLVGNII